MMDVPTAFSSPPGLASLQATRRSILMTLKKRFEASAAELAAELNITVSGVRQQVAGLLAEGMVARRQEARGPGRPTILYSLAPGGEALFPRFYAELTTELLSYVEQEDPALLEHIFERRRRRRERQARERLAGKASFSQRVAELTRILDEDGYLANVTHRPDGTFVVTEHNCAILGVAQRYGLACSTEIEFLRHALPDARVERVAHKLTGAHVCSYEITPKAKRPAKVRAG